MAGKTKIDVVRLIELHKKGLHPADIAKELGCDYGQVTRQLHNHNLVWIRKKRGSCKLTSEQEDEIIEKYTKEKMGATNIGKQYGVTKGAIYHLLYRRGIGTRSVASRRKPRKIPKNPIISERDLDILFLFKEGTNITDIAKSVGMADTSVIYSLNKQGAYNTDVDDSVAMRRTMPKRNKGLGSGNTEIKKDADLDHGAFARFDEHAYYWCGFIHADGCIHQGPTGNPRLFINLKGSDNGHLEKLKKWVRSSNKILLYTQNTFGKDRDFCRFMWTSQRHASDLRNMGVVPHKEGRFIVDAMRRSPAFWRGLVDGDGCIYTPKKGTLYLSGSHLVVSEWSKFVNNVLGDVDQVSIEDREAVSVGRVRFKKSARALLDILYGDAKIFLDRKYETAKQWA